jgi:hypothetical protein
MSFENSVKRSGVADINHGFWSNNDLLGASLLVLIEELARD